MVFVDFCNRRQGYGKRRSKHRYSYKRTPKLCHFCGSA